MSLSIQKFTWPGKMHFSEKNRVGGRSSALLTLQDDETRPGGTFMAGSQIGAAVRQLQTLFNVGTACGMTDDQLLSRFVSSRDHGAFEASSNGMGRWSPRSAEGCSRIRTTRRTRSRRRSWSWCGRPARSAAGRRWEVGCTGWPSTWRSRSTPRPHGVNGWRGGRGRWSNRARAIPPMVTSWSPASTRKSIGCRRSIGCRSCSATSRS